MKKNPLNLVWIDLEMTGLDTIQDHIIEIATVITDKNFEILAKGPNIMKEYYNYSYLHLLN